MVWACSLGPPVWHQVAGTQQQQTRGLQVRTAPIRRGVPFVVHGYGTVWLVTDMLLWQCPCRGTKYYWGKADDRGT